MRIFTLKEREYIANLAVRNFTSENYRDKKGLDKPMPTKERMMRLRIQRKALIAIYDLCLFDFAGVNPNEDDLSIIKTVREIYESTNYLLLTTKDKCKPIDYAISKGFSFDSWKHAKP